MVVTQDKSKRKPTGGRYKSATYYKRQHNSGSQPTLTGVGKTIKRSVRNTGGNRKPRLLSSDKVNVYDPKVKKTVATTIKNIVENTANQHFIRRNIMTKGAVIDTPKGKAKITNRPSQDGFVNATLIQ
jgi:small subunit ribosomal protein S8e